MSTSPSLRLSLRRKRSTRSGENNGSPAVKKNSPKLPEAKKEPPSTPKTRSSRHTNKLTRSASRTSPRFSKGQSTNKSDNEENLKTPVSSKWTHPNEDSLRQPSPDMPFLSSQLCGTQDCEVVWDCDSPGFSKDDLKRMHSGKEVEGPERAMPIAQAPPRQLFPQTRTRLSRASSLGNTTAQLNDLLDLLSSKENAGRRKNETEEDTHNLHKTYQQVVPPKDSHSENSSSSESLVLPRPLREASSQSFEVLGVSGPEDHNQTSLPSEPDESVWGDDLNLGLCDINDSVFEGHDSTRSSREGVGVIKDETDKSRLLSKNADLSSASADIFDDDLFSESVILSTQAVEEAMIIKDVKDVTNNRNYCGAYYSKGQQNELKNFIFKDEENSININSVKNSSKNDNKSELSTHNNITTSSLNTNSKILSKININQKNSSSDSPPQRQVRRSFRFGPSPKDAAKSGPSAMTRKTNHTLTSIPENQKPLRTIETRCELRKTNLVPALAIGKQTMQNTSVSNLAYTKLTKTSSVSSNPSTEVTKLPTTRRPLFRSSDIKVEEVRHRNNAQGTRGPLLRSQSIGNARLATSSPVTRRSNSSMELDTSQDLEDDEFFKSLLSMLPEEEGGISVNPTLPLTPITTENKSWGFHSSEKSLGNARLTVGNKVSDVRGKSNNNKQDTSNASVPSVSNGSVRSLLVSQVNLHPGVTNPKVGDSSGKRPVANVQGVMPNVTSYSAAKTKPLDTRDVRASGNGEQQSNDTFDDGLFEDDVLTLIDEVESQFGSQNAPSEPSPSPQSSQHQQIKCTQDEIARKKAAALQRREERRRQQFR